MNIFEELKLKLENTGLSENEAGVYIALLKTGESTTGKILEEYKMSAGKIYIVLDKLIKKGLVSYIIKKGIKHFKPHDPKNIIEFLEKEKQKIEKKENEIKTLLPELIKTINTPIDGLNVEIYEGIDGFKTAVGKIIEEHEIGGVEYEFDHFEFGTRKGEIQEAIKYIMLDYSRKMIKKRVAAKLLVSTTNTQSIKDVKEIMSGTNFEVRYIKNQKFASIFFTKDKTCIIDFAKPSVIFIRNKAVAEGFIKMFESMWPLGKKI